MATAADGAKPFSNANVTIWFGRDVGGDHATILPGIRYRDMTYEASGK
jgi:hypothetical protein